MAADLTQAAGGGVSDFPVVLAGDSASGLADMLQQFLEQSLSASPRKLRQARRLSGRALVRSAEDEEVCVGITFAGNRIEIRDVGATPNGDASITADFLTIAHLTSGQENPFRLLVRGKLRASFGLSQILFLLRLLQLMQLETSATRRQRQILIAGGVLAASLAVATYCHLRGLP